MYLSGGFRGRDGAGVVMVDNIGNVKIVKDGTAVDPFLYSKEFGDIEKDTFQKGWALIGHNRSATRGEISDKNSHPFVVDDRIVLVHNGTFVGDHKKLKDTDVDSEAIAHTLAETEDVELALRKINAAYALIWYDVDKKTINLIRNCARPLWWVETDSSYIYSSEQIFLQFVIGKYGLKTVEKPREIKEHGLNTFTLEKDKSTKETFKELDCSYYKHNTTHVVKVEGEDGDYKYPFGFGNYGGMADEYWKQESHRSNAPPIVLSTIHADQQNKVYDAIGNLASSTKFSDFVELQNVYDAVKTVRVLVDDLVQADNTPNTKNFLLIGRTMDKHRMHVVFPISDHTCENVIELTSKAVFDADFDKLTWKRMEHLFPVENGAAQDMWPGVCLLHAKNAKPIYLSTSAND